MNGDDERGVKIGYHWLTAYLYSS